MSRIYAEHITSLSSSEKGRGEVLSYFTGLDDVDNLSERKVELQSSLATLDKLLLDCSFENKLQKYYISQLVFSRKIDKMAKKFKVIL